MGRDLGACVEIAERQETAFDQPFEIGRDHDEEGERHQPRPRAAQLAPGHWVEQHEQRDAAGEREGRVLRPEA